MALQLTLDFALSIISEPGFHQRFSTRKLVENLDPTTVDGNKSFWVDPISSVIMLYPEQLNQNWLNTSAQANYAYRLTGLEVNATDIANGTIYEFAYQQNADNIWIFHGPVSPSASVPIVSLSGQADLDNLADQTEHPLSVTTFPHAGPPTGPPGPPRATTADAKVLCYTKAPLDLNQALYLRWHVGKAAAAFATAYIFFIGQFAVVCGPRTAEVFEDASSDGSRTSWRRLFTTPLFAAAAGRQGSPGGVGGAVGSALPVEEDAHDASLLWIPYMRGRVLMVSHTGRAHQFIARGVPELNGETGTKQDFNIVKPATLAVAALTPGPSWFQLQKVKWVDNAISFRLPTFTISYTPATPLTGANLVDDADAFHGTTLTHGTPSTPAGYDNRASHANDDCPPPTTDSSDQTRTYGVTYTLENAADGDGNKVFTPFLYGIDIRVPQVAGTWATSSTTLQDTTAGGTSPIARASIVSSLEPGEGRMDALIHDRPTGGSPAFALVDKWYRSNYPVKLFDGATNLFVGISEPNLLQPLRLNNDIMRELTITARDLWKWLEDTTLRDQRDWTGTGHITVVKSVVQQAGISVAGADTPSESSSWNSPLGGPRSQIDEITEALRPGWAPRDDPPDTAATYIRRIADQFANFAVGFYPDGTFYYLPRNPYLYTTSEATFFKSRAAHPTGPCYEEIEWENVEPEANEVFVTAHHATDGTRLRSTTFRDTASIVNPSVVNFIGRPKTLKEPPVINAAFTCPELNQIARAIWDRVRRRHLKGRFRADYIPDLKVGRLCTLEDQPGLYRVLSYRAEYLRPGFRKARYEIELDESGVGLPP